MTDQRSAPTGLTNRICNTCKAVTTHHHGDCIACCRYALDHSYDARPQWTLNDERRNDVVFLDERSITLELRKQDEENDAEWRKRLEQEIDHALDHDLDTELADAFSLWCTGNNITLTGDFDHHYIKTADQFLEWHGRMEREARDESIYA